MVVKMDPLSYRQDLLGQIFQDPVLGYLSKWRSGKLLASVAMSSHFRDRRLNVPVSRALESWGPRVRDPCLSCNENRLCVMPHEKGRCDVVVKNYPMTFEAFCLFFL